MMKHKLITAVLIVTLGGCAIGPDYKRPVLDLPATFPEATPSTAPAIQPSWWTMFGDSTLNNMVALAFKNNADAQIAVAQLEEAEAVARQTNASFLPEIDLGAGGSRSRVSTLVTPPGVAPLVRDDRRLAASTSFEIDFWGKLRRASEAARAQTLSSAYGRDMVMLTLASSTTQAYFSVRSLDAQIIALSDSVKTRTASLDLVKSRVESGFASDLDLNQAIGAQADAAAQLKELERQRAVALHLLSILTVKLDLDLPPADFNALPIPPVPPGLPSALLDRRPDIRAAEQNMIAANAQIGIAKAALFPTISLTGNYGGQSAALSDLLNGGARIWSAGFGLALPIFDAGRGVAKVDQAEARQKQAFLQYQKVVAVGFREIADAISNVRQAGLAQSDLQTRVTAARNSLDIAKARYESGYAGYLDVLDAQRTANDAELALVRNRQSQLSYTVDFMKALGGGWTAEPAR